MDDPQMAAIIAAISCYMTEEAQALAAGRARSLPSAWRMWSRRQPARSGPWAFPNARRAGLSGWRDPRYLLRG
ncbi:MAG: hypothetical protein HY689_14185 [Chloroflexi bacterium]|nr:hypothetical protein [Chloroflexota bacterium]